MAKKKEYCAMYGENRVAIVWCEREIDQVFTGPQALQAAADYKEDLENNYEEDFWVSTHRHVETEHV